jgi:hypothetical protein
MALIRLTLHHSRALQLGVDLEKLPPHWKHPSLYGGEPPSFCGERPDFGDERPNFGDEGLKSCAPGAYLYDVFEPGPEDTNPEARR